MKDKNIKGIDYKFIKLPALAQFHVVRRLAPIIGDLLTALGPNVKDLKEGQDLSEEQMLKIIAPVMGAISKLSDDDANYVIFSLLKPVTRKATAGGGWSKITTDGNIIMFEDIDLQAMVQLCVESFMVNLGGFINALPSGLKEGAVQVVTPTPVG